MRNIEELFDALRHSPFRARFQLNDRDANYLKEMGLTAILQHAEDFIAKRLAPAHPHRDGKQTPFKGHPVFVAQHGTATCCRTCLEKWHFIAKGVELSIDQRKYVIFVIERWLTDKSKTLPL